MQKFELSFPIEHDGAIIRAVLLRDPTADDLEKIAPGFLWSAASRLELSIDRTLEALARLTDLPIELINEVDVADFEALRDLAGAMMSNMLDVERGRKK